MAELTEILHVRVTRAEKRIVQKMAQRDGLRMSGVLRQVIHQLARRDGIQTGDAQRRNEGVNRP